MKSDPTLSSQRAITIEGRPPRFEALRQNSDASLLTQASIPLQIDFENREVRVNLQDMNNPDAQTIPDSHSILRAETDHDGATSTLWYDHRTNSIGKEILRLGLDISFEDGVEITPHLTTCAAAIRSADRVLSVTTPSSTSVEHFIIQPQDDTILGGAFDFKNRRIYLANDIEIPGLTFQPITLDHIDAETQLRSFGDTALLMGASAIQKAKPQQPLATAV